MKKCFSSWSNKPSKVEEVFLWFMTDGASFQSYRGLMEEHSRVFWVEKALLQVAGDANDYL